MNSIVLNRLALVGAAAAAVSAAVASSHRRGAGAIAGQPPGGWTERTSTCFRRLRTGSQRVFTLIANYIPLQDATGGPNFSILIRTRLQDSRGQRRRRCPAI